MKVEGPLVNVTVYEIGRQIFKWAVFGEEENDSVDSSYTGRTFVNIE